MSAAGQASGPGEEAGAHPGLLAKLVAAVRPEFRHDILVFAADDPVFGGEVCRVSGCGRVSHSGTKLCGGHYQRWRSQSQPDLGSFSACTSPLTGPRLRHPGTASAAAGGQVITPPAARCITTSPGGAMMALTRRSTTCSAGRPGRNAAG